MCATTVHGGSLCGQTTVPGDSPCVQTMEHGGSPCVQTTVHGDSPCVQAATVHGKSPQCVHSAMVTRAQAALTLHGIRLCSLTRLCRKVGTKLVYWSQVEGRFQGFWMAHQATPSHNRGMNFFLQFYFQFQLIGNKPQRNIYHMAQQHLVNLKYYKICVWDFTSQLHGPLVQTSQTTSSYHCVIRMHTAMRGCLATDQGLVRKHHFNFS